MTVCLFIFTTVNNVYIGSDGSDGGDNAINIGVLFVTTSVTTSKVVTLKKKEKVMGARVKVEQDEVAAEGDRLLEIWVAWQNTGATAGSRSLPRSSSFVNERVDNDHVDISDTDHPVAERVEAAMVVLKKWNQRACRVVVDYYVYDRNCKQIASSWLISEGTVKKMLKVGRYYIAGASV